jgi:hypothetical protein
MGHSILSTSTPKKVISMDSKQRCKESLECVTEHLEKFCKQW